MLYDVSLSATCHPLYNDRLEDYKFLRLAYLGGKRYLGRYLTPHPKERDAAFSRRLERAVYPNLCKVQVDTYAAQLYRSPVQRGVSPASSDASPAGAEAQGRASEVLRDFWEDADLLGNNADRFYRKAAIWCQVLGVGAVLVDKVQLPPGVAPPQSRADEVALGLRPFATFIPADQILDWECNAQGEFEWVLYAHEATTLRKPLSKAPGALGWAHTLWTREEVLELVWEAADEKAQRSEGWKVVSTRTNPLGLVPVELVFWGERHGKHPLANSALDDLAPMNRRLANLISLTDEEIYQHVFNILAVGEETFNNLQATNWSVAGVLKVSAAENEFAPTYLAPGVEQIKAISDEVEKAIRFMRMLSGNVGRGADDGLVPPSGLSLAYQSSDKFALFKEFSARMADLERRVADLVLAWEGIDPPSVSLTISYSQDFDPVLVSKTFEDALAFQALGIQGDPAIENEVQVIRRHFSGSLGQQELDVMIDSYRLARRQGGLGALQGQTQQVNLGSADATGSQELAAPTAEAAPQLNF